MRGTDGLPGHESRLLPQRSYNDHATKWQLLLKRMTSLTVWVDSERMTYITRAVREAAKKGHKTTLEQAAQGFLYLGIRHAQNVARRKERAEALAREKEENGN